MFRRKRDQFPPMSERAMRGRVRELLQKIDLAKRLPNDDSRGAWYALACIQGTLELFEHEFDMRIEFGGKRPIE